MRKPWLRPIAVLVLVAALAAGAPAQAAPAQASPGPALAGDLLAPLYALLEQAAGAVRSLWSVESAAGEAELEGDTAPLPGADDLLENGAGIDPNG